MAKGDDKKEKKAKVTDKEAQKMVLEYMEQQNRPYNAQIITDNLRGAVGKAQATKVLDALVDSGQLTVKEAGKQKIYWRTQEDSAEPRDIQGLDSKIASMKQELTVLNDEVKDLSTNLKNITSLPTDKEADSRIAAAEALTLNSLQNKDLKARLDAIKNNAKPVSDAQKKKIEKEYETSKGTWRKRKRMAKNIIDTIGEGTGKKYKECKEEIGFEDDDDFGGVNPDDDLTTKMRTGK
ncbi:nuclear receptor coactivator [Planoprotostelium fungivorum]|uniref:Homologous-pairing protein 2 homolog n=1 Tax=Planoprotostelium fungivorum TaxID=1890364 RepID=A0A2P6P0K0_9EUKA|nr:nuclear receptor coactivator [Planoprotostelium fungivorum]